MADKTTGELKTVKVQDLPAAPDIYDDFKMPGELQGEAVHVTGAQMKQYAAESVLPIATRAEKAAENAASYAKNAEESKNAAKASVQRVEDMSVEAVTLSHDKAANVSKVSGKDALKLIFGIPGGKSAYQYAVDVGYTGTEKEFTELLTANAGVSYVADGGSPGSFDTLVFDGGTPFTVDELMLDGGTP